MSQIFHARAGMGRKLQGRALVAKDGFSARYDLNRIKGVFSRPSHALHGQSYVAKILVLNTAKGGVATAWMLREMAARGMAPAALLFNSVNPILAQGAAFAPMALIDRFAAGCPTTLIRTGDELSIDPAKGLVTILNRD